MISSLSRLAPSSSANLLSAALLWVYNYWVNSPPLLASLGALSNGEPARLWRTRVEIGFNNHGSVVGMCRGCDDFGRSSCIFFQLVRSTVYIFLSSGCSLLICSPTLLWLSKLSPHRQTLTKKCCSICLDGLSTDMRLSRHLAKSHRPSFLLAWVQASISFHVWWSTYG